MSKFFEQSTLDHKRRVYQLSFPADLDPEQVTEFFRQVSGVLRPKTSMLADVLGLSKAEQMVRGMPSIVLETWGTATGIQWLLKVPYGYEPLVRGRLEALIPGVQIQHIKSPPKRVWVHGVELALRAGHRPMNIRNAVLTSASVRSPFGHVAPEESLILQWVVTPMTPEHKPEQGTATSKETGLQALLNGTKASRDEVAERRDKLAEPNLLTSLRVAAVAASPSRASMMVRNVTASFDSARGAANYFTVQRMPISRLRERIANGTTPLIPPVQVSAPEMTCFVGWPLGDMQVPGQPAPLSRRIPAPSNVLDEGIKLGTSNYSGRERPVALGFKEAVLHSHTIGPQGVGKTIFLSNKFKQIVEAGYGAFVIEKDGNLIEAALNYVPPEREHDVIYINAADVKYPVGINLLKMGGDANLAASGLDGIFRTKFRDHPSIYAVQAMHHGMRTLAEDPNSTIIDLPALLSPMADEVEWSRNLRNKVRDPQLHRYWQGIENLSKSEAEKRMEPTLNRYWPIMQSQLVNIFGQSKSSFTMEEVVRQNKILLVNLKGLGEDAVELMGAIMVNAIWEAVRANPMPHSPNFLVMDEAQTFMNLPLDLNEMLAQARKYGLGIDFAHQALYQLPPDMRQAIHQNTQTKVAFQVLADDSKEMARVLGHPTTDYDLSHMPKYSTIARVATPTGVSTPFTMTTDPPAKGHGNAERIIYASRGRYGRPISQVQDEILARRSPPAKTRRRNIPDPRPEDLDLGGVIP